MNGYVCFYNQKRIEIYADSSYSAQCKAAEKLRIKPRLQHKINVMLAEKDGKQYVHSTAGI